MKTLDYNNNNVTYKIRVSKDEKGQFIFVAKDIAKAIGYKDTTNAIKKYIEEQHKHFRLVTTSRGIKKMIIIGKDGLNDLFSTKRFNTEPLKQWIEEIYNPIEVLQGELLPARSKRQKQADFTTMIKSIFVDLDIKTNVKIGLYTVDIFIEEFSLIIETTDIDRKRKDIERTNEINSFINHFYKYKYNELINANYFYVEKGNEFEAFRKLCLKFENLNGVAATDYMKKKIGGESKK